ncbi:MAG: CPBP family intramembrane metalloprotease [Oscillospiraceae bacterium]|nr:CPBP family intramembrane metalloprotease [Oscillospiraceae bacterium]
MLKKRIKDSAVDAVENEAERSLTDVDDIDEKAALVKKNTLLMNRIWAALGALALFVGYFALPNLFYSIFSQDAMANNGTVKLLASSMGFFVYFFFLIRFYMKRSHKTGEELSDVLQLHPRSLECKPALICCLLGVSLNLFIGAALALLPFPEQLIADYSASSGSLVYNDSIVFSVIYVVVLAPVCEELMFRGFIFHRLNTQFPLIVTVISVSLMFALPHIQILWIIVALANGIIFTLVRAKFNNLCYSLILHCCYNLVSVPMLLLAGTQIHEFLFNNIFAELVYLILGGGSVFLCTQWLLKDKDAPNTELSYDIK